VPEKERHDPQPPQPPPMRRRLGVRRTHAVGQLGIVLITVLAVLGVFGASRETADASGNGLAVLVEYTTRTRYTLLEELRVTLASADSGLEGLAVVVSAPYVEAFSNTSFRPEPSLITREVVIIPVGDIGPGETRVVSGELQANRYWLHDGWVEVRRQGELLVRIPIATFVFP
jgi:hypothetical protein